MIAFIDKTALPNLDRTLASTEAAVQSGMSGAGMIPESRYMQTNMRIERAAALRERERAVAELLLMTAQAANGADLLPSAGTFSQNP